MQLTVEELSAQARALSDEDKLRLVDSVMEQVLQPGERWLTAWGAEVRERRALYHAGKLGARPYEEVLARLRGR